MNKKERQSNFELLRIIALFMVLIFHSNIHTNGIPTIDFVSNNPLIAYNIYVVQGISVICVNVFVLLSGWFGIKPKTERVLELIYQVLFFLLGSYIIALLFGKTTINADDILTCFLLNDYAWFIKSYLCLMIFAPMLNIFSQTASKKELTSFLVVFYVFQSIYGWATNAASFFNYGSSVVSFCGLYLLAQYIKRFQPGWSKYSKTCDLLFYFGLVAASAVFLVVLSYFSFLSPIYHSLVGHMYAYSSPIVVAECLFIFLFFSKLAIKSRFINYVAISCFSALFVHGNPYIFPYQARVLSFYSNNCYSLALLKVFLLSMEAFVLAILLDQIRIYSWELLQKVYVKRGKNKRSNN